MAASLGMLGIGSFSANVAPGNFREAILREYPQGGAVFTMILGMLPSESVNSRKFTWFEQGLPQQRFAVAGQHAADATTIDLDTAVPISNTTPAYSFKTGHLVRVESTGEIMLVVGKNGTHPDHQLTVVRGVGNSAVGYIIDDHGIITIVGHADQEGADTPTSINYAPTEEWNYVQTIRTALDLTDDAAQEYYRTGDIMKNEKFDKAMDHALDQERAYLWGKRESILVTTGDFTSAGTGLNHRMMGGLWNYLGASYSTNFASTGLTKTGWHNFLKPIYTVQNGSMNKAAFCGATFLQAINDYAEQNSHISVEPGDKTYGLTIRSLYHPWGELKLIPHPLFSEHEDWSKMAVIVDLKNVKYRFLRNRDTRFLLERQGNGEDRVTHEFMTKCSLELRFKRTHGIAYGVSEYVA